MLHRLGIYRRIRPAREILPLVDRWFASDAGRALLASEQRDIDRALAYLFGYHLCQLSACRNRDLMGVSRISHRFALSPCASAGGVEAACCSYRHLPLAPESVDVFLLHHCLDFSQTPHQLLAEVARATIAHGYVVIVGFNPWSIAGLWRRATAVFSRHTPWRHQWLRRARLLDWLALLDLEPELVECGQFWPFGTATKGWFEHLMRRLRAPWGSYYTIVARKEVSAVIPCKPRWRTARLQNVKGVGLPGEGRLRVKLIVKKVE